MIIDEPVLKFRGDPFHPYHFHCYNCKVELTADAREKNDELYCLRCHDKVSHANGTGMARDWYGNGTGMAWKWHGNGMGMTREWHGNGNEMERQ